MSALEQHSLRRKRVFVTGATGLVGGHLIDALAGEGAEVTALVRDEVPRSRFARRRQAEVNVVSGAVENYRLIERALAEYEIEVVFHLAAQTIVPIAYRAPIGTFRANIEGTWNVLEACRQVGHVAAVVVASSDKAYGSAERLPYNEDTPLRAEHPYDVSKACGDLIARAYWVTYGVPVTITRCGNIFGPGDLNFSRIIPGTIRSALLGERPQIRSDGTLIRDYFYVKDAAQAYLMSARALLASRERMGGEALNFSNEQRLTVLEVTKRILAIMGRADLEPEILAEARAEIAEQSLSAARARKLLGWAPRYDFEAGVRETVEFVRQVVEIPG